MLFIFTVFFKTEAFWCQSVQWHLSQVSYNASGQFSLVTPLALCPLANMWKTHSSIIQKARTPCFLVKGCEKGLYMFCWRSLFFLLVSVVSKLDNSSKKVTASRRSSVILILRNTPRISVYFKHVCMCGGHCWISTVHCFLKQFLHFPAT